MKAQSRQPRRRASAASEAPPPGKTGIFIVDDHPVLREGLSRVIAQCEDLTVCGQAASALEALEALKHVAPGLIIVDIALGAQTGLELIKDLKIRFPLLPVLVYSMFDESLYAVRCLRAGAVGYVMKQEPPSTLLGAARQVLRGELYLSETMTRQMLTQFSQPRVTPEAMSVDRLTDREFAVFELLGRGHTTKEIAHLLHLSAKTVQTHREHIKRKLGLRDAVSLIRHAVQWTESQTAGAQPAAGAATAAAPRAVPAEPAPLPPAPPILPPSPPILPG